MQHASSITPHSGDLLVIVGTVKGAFIFSCDRNRREFKIAGPYFKGQSVFSTAFFQDNTAHPARSYEHALGRAGELVR